MVRRYLSRRSLVKALVAIALIPPVAKLGYFLVWERKHLSKASLLEKFTKLFSGVESSPSDFGVKSNESLESVLCDILSAPSLNDGVSLSDLRAKLNSAIQEDYEAQRIVFVDGWCISRTEARLAVASKRSL